MSSKLRLDALMTTRKLVASRSQAESYIRLGKVQIRENYNILQADLARNFDKTTRAKMTKNDWTTIKKPGFFVRDNGEIRLNIDQQFVSRAALKLQAVASALDVDFTDKTVLDIGSSTGGFTQFALLHGAKKVLAIEVGTRQLSPILRHDETLFSKIELHEKTDIRDFQPNDPQTKIDLVLADVSFISLTKLLPIVLKNLRDNFTDQTEFILMVKPQFEAKLHVHHMAHGIVKNETERSQIFTEFELFAKNYFLIQAKKDSEVTGVHGNRERFYKMRLSRQSLGL